MVMNLVCNFMTQLKVLKIHILFVTYASWMWICIVEDLHFYKISGGTTVQNGSETLDKIVTIEFLSHFTEHLSKLYWMVLEILHGNNHFMDPKPVTCLNFIRIHYPSTLEFICYKASDSLWSVLFMRNPISSYSYNKKHQSLKVLHEARNESGKSSQTLKKFICQFNIYYIWTWDCGCFHICT